MEILNEIITEYGLPILGSILTAIASYVGLKVKSIYETYVNDKTKETVVKNVVKMVEQTCKDLHGEEKYNEAVSNVTEILNNKGITITELEIKTLIEATCSEFVKEVSSNE